VHALLGQPVIARRFARLLGRPELTTEDHAKLIALAALHDLGKINRGFQRKPFFKGPPVGHVTPVVTLLAKRGPELRALLQQGNLHRLLHVLADPSGDLMPFDAILAHHGSLPCEGSHDRGIWHAADGYDPIRACRELVEAVVGWCQEALGLTPLGWNPAFQHAFAGLLMLADWLGSDQRHFAMPGGDVPDGVARYAWAKPVAEELLKSRGLAPDRARAAASTLPWDARTLTGYDIPSPAQAAMLAMPAAGVGGRTCVIEDETGSGKTEAALVHFLDLFRKGEVDGMYFALPTRAAARQIHGRIEAALRRLLGDAAPHVTLAVPGYVGRDLVDAPLPDTSALWVEPGADQDAMWSSERPKRYLASWVAIGTIDQVLMGGLRVRHAQLRSAAMLRLLLVVDEVHASDVYMTTILRNLLDQHRRAGGHALLMSATLGAAARAALLKLSGRVKPEEYAAAVGRLYPAMWTDAHDGPLPRPSVKQRQKEVRVTIETNWRDPGAIVAWAVKAARRGARVLVIRNTVRDVVAAQRALEDVAPELSLTVSGPAGPVCCPHHARYAPEDRARLDAALESVLGKKSEAGASVTITSQTAEQSLDIDADLLITDLCPADVLLQRIGRLHRHSRPRPAGFEAASTIVLAPTEAELAASIGKDGDVRSGPLALGLVYPDLLGIVATRRTLAAMQTVSIPCDNRRLVEAATHPDARDSLAQELGGVFMANWMAHRGKTAAQAREADDACLKWCKRIAPLPPNERIVTRLGLNDRAVELQPGTVGPFGNEISLISVPGRWLGGVTVDDPLDIAVAPGGLSIALGDRKFVYDRLGLRPA
jgi:CRISPR-associated endonuclease/helicase Cas3